ncbi:MAG: hypothetical protein WAO54_03230 [Eubacteriales bacterium]
MVPSYAAGYHPTNLLTVNLFNELGAENGIGHFSGLSFQMRFLVKIAALLPMIVLPGTPPFSSIM